MARYFNHYQNKVHANVKVIGQMLGIILSF